MKGEVFLINSCSFLGLMHCIAWRRFHFPHDTEKAPVLLSHNNLLQCPVLAKKLSDEEAFNFVFPPFSFVICNLTKLRANDCATSSALNRAAGRSARVEEKVLTGNSQKNLNFRSLVDALIQRHRFYCCRHSIYLLLM